MNQLHKINTISGLIDVLQGGCDQNCYLAALNNLKLKEDSVQDFCNWSDEYTRNLIFKNDDFEIILMCWGEGQETAIHDHAGQEGWIYQISGEITEYRYKAGTIENPLLVTCATLKPGQFGYINDKIGLHKIKNTFDGPSIGLHIYAKPLIDCKVYDPKEKKASTKNLTYFNKKALTV